MQQISNCAFTALWKRTSDEVDEVQRRAMQSFDPEKETGERAGIAFINPYNLFKYRDTPFPLNT